MPKNTNNKKGKQKETPAAAPAPPPAPPPPPPPLAPPPLAPPPPIMTIDTIEEEDDDFGTLDNMDADDHNEDSWEQMHDTGSGPQDLNGWASQDPQNSNGGWANDEQWETSAPPQAQMPPQPPQKDSGNTKSQKKHQHQHPQQQHQHPHQQQQQHQHHQQQHQQHQHQQVVQHHQPQNNDGWGGGGGAWDDAGGTPAPAKKQTPKGNWSQTTQRAMDEPAWSTWGHEAGWEQDGDTSETEEEEWPDEDDPWGAPVTTHAPQAYAQKQSAHPPQMYAQRQPNQPSGWQTWGEEAQKLPKGQQPYAVANPPPGTGGYFQPQGANKQVSQQQGTNKQWSQQQAAMAAAFRQQQEQAYALAQAQSQHRQLQQQQQQRQNQVQHDEAYTLAHVQSQLRQQQHRNQPQQDDSYALANANLRRQVQHHQSPNQPQHEGKKNKKDKENRQQQQSKKETKRQQRQQEQQQQHDNDVWGLGEGWQDLEDDPEDHEDTHDEWGRRVHFSPPHIAPSVVPSTVVENFTVNAFPPNKLGLSAYSTPSKTLTYAYHGTATSMESAPARNSTQDYADFIESKGAALKPVAGAFFGHNSRMAKDRFHWMFSPDKDERVASLLSWIQSVSYGLGSFGLHKFLQTRERGALVVNADYRPSKSPNEPAFDWLTYPELQKTMDRTLQESVAYYDPSVLVVVFVFLPSKSGNSLAIWRRKIAVPNNVRLAYQAQITQAIAALGRDYAVHVDEMPPPKTEPPNPPPKKRKWWKLWLST